MRLFNIPHNDNNNSAISSTVYQTNLKYSLCFKRPRDHCGVSTEEWWWRCLISGLFQILITSRAMSVGNIKTDSDCTSANPFASTTQTGTDRQFFLLTTTRTFSS